MCDSAIEPIPPLTESIIKTVNWVPPNAIAPKSVTCAHPGRDRPVGDRGERHGEREIVSIRADLDIADDGAQREGQLEHREVIADA